VESVVYRSVFDKTKIGPAGARSVIQITGRLTIFTEIIALCLRPVYR